MYKHSSLLQTFPNYCCRKFFFFNLGSWIHTHTTIHYICNLRMGTISQNVCRWQALLAYSNVTYSNLFGPFLSYSPGATGGVRTLDHRIMSRLFYHYATVPQQENFSPCYSQNSKRRLNIYPLVSFSRHV
jgi:hypothetical protein